MQIVIDIDEDVYKKIVADKYAIYDKMFYSIKNGTPHENVTEFADRCRECGARYGKALERTRWIPVSERLPEESITVIGTTEFDDIYKTELYDDCGEKKWYANGNFDVPIVAWMPLPEPYKAESEGKE